MNDFNSENKKTTATERVFGDFGGVFWRLSILALVLPLLAAIILFVAVRYFGLNLSRANIKTIVLIVWVMTTLVVA